jgi:hypothetical protein
MALLAYFVALIYCFVGFLFVSSPSEESALDAEYVAIASSVESEKELGAVDDIYIGVISIVLTFGIYFCSVSVDIFNIITEMFMLGTSVLLFYYILINMPIMLIYDFGIHFLGYMRGIGPSANLTMELMYDYIAFSAFFIRILVQNVRIILIMVTYVSLHDFILYSDGLHTLLIGADIRLSDFCEQDAFFFKKVTFYIIVVLPLKMTQFMYELLHTFFVITAQFVAFFAMVF